MPHSSGGGSHSGGHHSGSHHSGSHSYHYSGGYSSSSYRPTFKKSSSYFEGSKKYVYYVNKKPEYIYANYDIKPNDGCEKTLAFGCLSAIWIFFIFLSLGLVMLTSRHAPKKLLTDYNTEIVIQDDADIISDKVLVRDAFERFFNQTGITPALKTLSREEWDKEVLKYQNIPEDDQLEKYAYDWYIENFKDEKHWLIVYLPDSDLSDNFDDWKWEGMQGNDTDPILGDRETSLFNENFQKYLLQRNKYSVGEAVASAFDTLTPIAMEKYIPPFATTVAIIACVVFSIMFLPPMLLIISDSKKKKKYRTAVECPEGYTDQEKCPFCQGIYIAGLHEKCPHCGAEIQKKD